MLAKLIGRFRDAHSNHRRVAAGTLWIGLYVLIAKLCVAAREMAIAWRYGIGVEVDAYQLALTVTTWLPMMLFGVFAVVLVPRLIALRRAGRDEAFIGELNGAAMVAGVALALLTWIAAPLATELLAAGLGAPTLRLAKFLAVQMAPVAFLITVGGYLSARLQAREHYAYSLAEAAPALVIALFLIFARDSASTMPLLYGTILGYIVYALWLARMTAVSDAPLGRLRFRRRSQQWPLIYGPLLVMGLGQLFITVTLPLDQAFAASLGEGRVATLGYVNRIVTLVTSFGSIVFARALLPVLSHMAAKGEHKLGRGQALKWAWLMAGLAAAAAIAGWLLAPLGVQLLFERGAFDAQDSRAVSDALRFGLLQLPPFFAGIVLVQWYAAANRYPAILAITFVALLAKAALNALLIGPLGIGGILVATAAMYLVTTLLMALGLVGRRSRLPKGAI